jgi:hypothetical protein
MPLPAPGIVEVATLIAPSCCTLGGISANGASDRERGEGEVEESWISAIMDFNSLMEEMPGMARSNASRGLGVVMIAVLLGELL